MKNVCINLKNSQHAFVGRSYDGVPDISNAPKSSEYLIVLRLGSSDKFPYDNMTYKWVEDDTVPGGYRMEPKHPYGGKRSPFIVHNDWKEGLIAIAAHEARHIYQYRNGKSRSEVDAEKFAAKRLDAYRKMMI